MQASRELDALVAEHVCNWQWATFAGVSVLFPPDRQVEMHSGWKDGKTGEVDVDSSHFYDSRRPNGYTMPIVPHYSTEIAAAWEIVAHLTKHYHWRISSPFDPPHGETRWFAGLTPHSCTGWNGRPDLECGGKTAQEAICLVALKAVGAIPLEDRDVDSTLAALAADHA